MRTVPLATPVTVPSVPTVAIDAEAVLQTPPGVRSVRDVVRHTQTLLVPVIVPATGAGFIVTTTEDALTPHELVIEYDIVAVPVAIPVTTPIELTVATPVAVELQVPPVIALERAVVAPTQAVCVPVMGPALVPGLTVITVVARQPAPAKA